MLEMIKDTAETRYMKLLKKHPDVFQNVPLKIIASYLELPTFIKQDKKRNYSK
jgi:hypothetical protein